MIKKSIKYLLYAVALLLSLLVLLVLFTQTPWFDKIVKKQAIQIINNQLNASVSIEELNSNYYDFINLLGVELRQETDSTLITQVDSINLQFNLWALFNKTIDINSVNIIGLNGHFEQDENGKWKVADIIPASSDTTKSSTPFSFTLQIDAIHLMNWNLTTASSIKLIPDSIQNLNLNASLLYQQNMLDIQLQQLELTSSKPDLSVKSIKGHYKQTGSLLSFDSLWIETSGSLFEAKGSYDSINNSSAQFIANPINNDELKIFVPSVQVPSSPDADIDYLTQNDTTYLIVDLSINREKIQLQSQLLNLEDFSKQRTNHIPFNANITFDNVHPENWWLMNKTNGTLNGAINLKGSHLFDYKTWNKIDGDLTGSSYLDHHFQIFKFNARQNNDSIQSDLIAQSYLGKAEGSIELNNYTTHPSYRALLRIDSLLLNKIISEDAGIANGYLSLEGRNFNIDSIDAQSIIRVYPSTIYNIPIDSANIKAELRNNHLEISHSEIFVPNGTVDAVGDFQLTSKLLNAEVDFSFDSLHFIQHFNIPELMFDEATGQISITGSVDSLQSNGQIQVSELNGFSISSNRVNALFDAQFIQKQIQANTSFQIQSLKNSNILADSIYGDLNYRQDNLLAEIFAIKDSTDAKIKTQIHLTDTIGVNLNEVRINTPKVRYYTTDTFNFIQYYKNEITIKDLALKDELSPQFAVRAQGSFGANKPEDFHLQIDNFDLNSINRYNLIDEQLGGIFSIDLNLTGEPQNPELKSYFDIKNGQYDKIQLPYIKGDLGLKNDTLESNIFNPQQKNVFKLSFLTPVTAKFDTTGFNFAMSDYFEAFLQLDSLNIATQTENIAHMDAQGRIEANIQAKGSYNKPLFYGDFSLIDGGYSNPSIGIDYRNAQIALNFDSNQVAIDTFIVKRDKGYLTITGEASFDTSFVSGHIHSSTLEADAKDFYVIKHRDYSALIDAKSFYQDINDTAKFGGQIKVLRSEFYLPAFTETEENNTAREVPLLVQATSSVDSVTNSTRQIKLKKKDEEESSLFIKNLQGRLELEIPRNTWLRSEDMSIEIWGDLEIEKSNPYFELYGEVGINRGHYILYGKKLVINEGQLTFQGGEKIDPILDFQATYTYRGPDKEKRNLKLLVSEKLSEPSIAFTLDGVSIPEGDAVSILIFGKTMDELSYSGQNGIAGSIGTDMLAKAVTSQLSKTLGTRFNLDMIEVTATENWQSAAFVVGKYVTNDLFVIYQRGFGETDGDEITPEMIILEYELNRILFVRLQSGSSKESGFDVILKFESKND
ncbi:translocation/assembly module TamB domain-containing protein [Carboxylicivirga linearis]|uniref:Translocation/assembly module TamB domain-containing protein n=1 Tax=Carboxylicivirga linearis TaxID=1628157 RepID=A0ABS5JQV1_9BACT|nr:translocation/assembly module TamB domain-containing protein [Carboxylicivirga linearis]MBS2097234.1 translocation/assembly module TamB domain-containing protein [Carboxylicivirga linearis]